MHWPKDESSRIFVTAALLDTALYIATRFGLYLLIVGKAHWTLSSSVYLLLSGYVMARFHCHFKKRLNDWDKWRVGSFFLSVQSLIANEFGNGRKLLSEIGRDFRRWCMMSTSLCGVSRCAFNTKWINCGSIISVSESAFAWLYDSWLENWLILCDRFVIGIFQILGLEVGFTGTSIAKGWWSGRLSRFLQCLRRHRDLRSALGLAGLLSHPDGRWHVGRWSIAPLSQCHHQNLGRDKPTS